MNPSNLHAVDVHAALIVARFEQAVLEEIHQLEVHRALDLKSERLSWASIRREHVKQAFLHFSVSTRQHGKVPLVGDNRLPVDFAIGGASVIGRTKSDQVVEAMLSDLRPRDDVVKFDGRLPTGRDSAAMASFNFYLPCERSGDRGPALL